MLIFGKNASFFVWNTSCKFKGSHTDAEKSDQNKKACSYFAFQFNISENWQHAASLSPRFVTPTWLLVVLADVFRCSKLCGVAAEWGISTPDPSGAQEQMHVLFVCSPPTSVLPSSSLCSAHTVPNPSLTGEMLSVSQFSRNIRRHFKGNWREFRGFPFLRVATFKLKCWHHCVHIV